MKNSPAGHEQLFSKKWRVISWLFYISAHNLAENQLKCNIIIFISYFSNVLPLCTAFFSVIPYFSLLTFIFVVPVYYPAFLLPRWIQGLQQVYGAKLKIFVSKYECRFHVWCKSEQQWSYIYRSESVPEDLNNNKVITMLRSPQTSEIFTKSFFLIKIIFFL